MKKIISRLVGFEKEQTARRWLEKQGIQIVAQNFTCKGGEIDLIGLDQDTLVAFEIRYRKHPRHGNAAESITPAKLARLQRCLAYFLLRHPNYAHRPLRIDAILFEGQRAPRWLKNISGF
ncbi:MAG TPA: YraN family protein [Sulfurivirga caldicuralii]|nr:YraN family protein [Sulfurivirga caldicuralii]